MLRTLVAAVFAGGAVTAAVLGAGLGQGPLAVDPATRGHSIGGPGGSEPPMHRMPEVDTRKNMEPFRGTRKLLVSDRRTTHEPSGTGAFRIWCWPTKMANDDPIVYPGQPGAAHHHTFFGYGAIRAGTDLGARTVAGYRRHPNRLTRIGRSTCQGGVANRSSYWVPSMINTRNGKPIPPVGTLVYYKGGYRVPDAALEPVPPGLRFVAGDMRATKPQPDPAPYHQISSFACRPAGQAQGASTRSIPACAVGGRVTLTLSFPQCWDGKRLDSEDHRSHMAYSGTYRDGPTPGCPATHPHAIPQLTLNVYYDVTSKRFGTRYWRLASDAYARDGYNGGYSVHGDYVNGWDAQIMADLVAACLTPGKDCGGPDLQDGRYLEVVPRPE